MGDTQSAPTSPSRHQTTSEATEMAPAHPSSMAASEQAAAAASAAEAVPLLGGATESSTSEEARTTSAATTPLPPPAGTAAAAAASHTAPAPAAADTATTASSTPAAAPHATADSPTPAEAPTNEDVVLLADAAPMQPAPVPAETTTTAPPSGAPADTPDAAAASATAPVVAGVPADAVPVATPAPAEVAAPTATGEDATAPTDTASAAPAAAASAPAPATDATTAPVIAAVPADAVPEAAPAAVGVTAAPAAAAAAAAAATDTAAPAAVDVTAAPAAEAAPVAATATGEDITAPPDTEAAAPAAAASATETTPAADVAAVPTDTLDAAAASTTASDGAKGPDAQPVEAAPAAVTASEEAPPATVTASEAPTTAAIEPTTTTETALTAAPPAGEDATPSPPAAAEAAAATAAPPAAVAATSAAAPGRRRYSVQELLGVLQQIDLSVLTGRPAMAAEESDPVHGVCVAGPKEVVMNLHNLMVGPLRTIPVPAYSRLLQTMSAMSAQQQQYNTATNSNAHIMQAAMLAAQAAQCQLYPGLQPASFSTAQHHPLLLHPAAVNVPGLPLLHTSVSLPTSCGSPYRYNHTTTTTATTSQVAQPRSIPMPEFVRRLQASSSLPRQSSMPRGGGRGWTRADSGGGGGGGGGSSNSRGSWSSHTEDAAASAAAAAALRPIRTNSVPSSSTKLGGGEEAHDTTNNNRGSTPGGTAGVVTPSTPTETAAHASTQPHNKQPPPPPDRLCSYGLPDNLGSGWNSEDFRKQSDQNQTARSSSGGGGFQPSTPALDSWGTEHAAGASSHAPPPPLAVQPGSALWQQTVKQLLGLSGGGGGPAGFDSVGWLVQSPGIAGSMGPIPPTDMAAWLLQGVTPKQLSRPAHKPVVEATAADPGSLLVCGLMAAEVDKGLKPGMAAFKPLRELLPGLAAGLDYSAAAKDLVGDNSLRQQQQQRTSATSTSAQQQPGATGGALPAGFTAGFTGAPQGLAHIRPFVSSFAGAGDSGSQGYGASPFAAMGGASHVLDRTASSTAGDTNSPMLRHQYSYGTPSARNSSSGFFFAPGSSSMSSSASFEDYRKRFAPDACSPFLLVSQLQELAAVHDFTGATAAAQEVSRRARSSGEVREVLIREGAVSALFKLLQQPLQMDVVGAGQPHAAAAWALFDLVGRSKAAPQGDPLAQAAMASSGAVGALTAVLKAVWRYGGSMMSQTAASQQGVDPLLGGTSGSGSLLLRSTSTASNFSLSSVSSGPQQEVAAGVQEATAAALSVLATTPAGKEAIRVAGAVPSIIRLLGSGFPAVVTAAVGALRNLSVPESYTLHTALFRAGAVAMLVHVFGGHPDTATRHVALRILLDLAHTAPSNPVSPVSAAGQQQQQPSTPTTSPSAIEDFTAENVVREMIRRGMPVLVLKLLHGDTPKALQARAMEMLLLLAAQQQGREVLESIKNLLEYENTPAAATASASASAQGQAQGSSYTGVQVLQKLMRTSPAEEVRVGAIELLQSMTDAGISGRPSRQSHAPAG